MNLKVTTGTVQAFLLAILWGIAATALALGATLSSIIILVVSGIVLAIRHQSDWIATVLGVVVGVLFAVLAGVAIPEGVVLVVIFGAVWF